MKTSTTYIFQVLPHIWMLTFALYGSLHTTIFSFFSFTEDDWYFHKLYSSQERMKQKTRIRDVKLITATQLLQKAAVSVYEQLPQYVCYFGNESRRQQWGPFVSLSKCILPLGLQRLKKRVAKDNFCITGSVIVTLRKHSCQKDHEKYYYTLESNESSTTLQWKENRAPVDCQLWP